MELPRLPTGLADFIPYLSKNSDSDPWNAVGPYKQYESKLREIYAQEPANPVLSTDHVNTVPIFAGNEPALKTRARNLAQETREHQDKYLLALSDKDRKPHGSPAVVGSLKEFRNNFHLFSESSLVDLDWNNVIAAGSGVVTALLPVPSPHNDSKRALRAYYHETLAPASDVDLFLYGLTEKQAIEKIKQIEAKIRDSILTETTTIRTKHAITVVSQYPTRHVQIVLRLYKSIDEILTGFDVDSSCVAYDGTQVWASPRAIAAFVTQINTVDLTRRSPSYENRLAKYAKRGFEIWWPHLDRSKIDPTIFERQFSRVQGLARLLVLEQLPHPNDRDQYAAQRRAERGRPALPWTARYRQQLPGNVKESDPDDVAEWVEEQAVSNYHTFTIPYGPKYTAKRVEKLLFTKDLLLNAEWNRPKGRETNLHRHPWFFGSVHDVIHDCCGFCPEAKTDEDLAALEEEEKQYISGDVKFLTENPGRQAIGSFHPITDDDFTEMAYVGNTARLCQAILDQDLEHVQDWCSQTDADVNRRDHVGRSPLHLAAMCSSPEVLQCLIDHGARIVARVVDGMTALHMAAHRGEVQMVKALMLKSAANEEAEDKKTKMKRQARRQAIGKNSNAVHAATEKDDDEDAMESDDESFLGDGQSQEFDRMTDGSFVKVDAESPVGIDLPEDKDEPDVYDVDVLAWDAPVSPLHLAIMAGHVEVIEALIDSFGADVLLPVKIMHDHDRRSPKAAILTIALALKLLPQEEINTVTALLRRGASSAQADMSQVTTLHYVVNESKSMVLDLLLGSDGPAAKQAVNHLVLTGWQHSVEVVTPLLTAIERSSQETVDRLIAAGAHLTIEFDKFSQAFHRKFEHASTDPKVMMKIYGQRVDQPIIQAVREEMTELVVYLIEQGIDVNTLPRGAFERLETPANANQGEDKSLLDLVQDKLEALNEYVRQVSTKLPVQAPEKLENDEVYLNGYVKGSYRQWLAECDLAQAKAIKYERQMKNYEELLNAGKSTVVDGEPEKLAAVSALIHRFQVLEATLLKKGAKTFYQLHPQLERPPPHTTRAWGYFDPTNASLKKGLYENDQSFLVPDLTASKRDAYFLLFDAAWNGDAEQVKSVTMSNWGKENQLPLQVAVQDLCGFSPFSIAVLRGHTDLAKTILGIVHAQYEPRETTEKYVYKMEANSDDDSSVSNDNNLNIYGELLDDEFTVDDVAALGRNIKSKVSPMQVLNWYAEMWRTSRFSEHAAKGLYMHSDTNYYVDAGGEPGQSWAWFHAALRQESQRCRASLLRFAIAENKMQTLKFLLQTGSELASRNEQESSKLFSVSQADLDYAVRLGRVEMIGEIIKSTGASIPLQKLVQQSGVVGVQKPTYYQGLTVHGKKRSDWAEAGRGTTVRRSAEDEHVPMLRVILEGNLESTEYFLTDAPLRRYQEFAQAHKNDQQIQNLSQAEGGIEKSLKTWLTARSHLAIHMAVMAPPRKDGCNPVLDFLIQYIPDAVDATSAAGATPLQVAFKLQRLYAAQTLIKAGANQATRNLQGENLVHTIIKSRIGQDSGAALQAALSLLDQTLVPSMLLDRCGGTEPGSLTPLAMAINPGVGHSNCQDFVLDVLLKYSQGRDLEMMDGAGDYPLHVLVRNNNIRLAQHVINYNPALLYRENAVGMTPLDVVQSTFLREWITNPPSLPSRHFYYRETAADRGILKKSAHDFVQVDERLSQSMFDMSKEMAAAKPDRRHLVSLLDANEVAKRLAIQQKKKPEEQHTVQVYMRRRHANVDSETGDANDEVAQWLGKAQEFPKLDLKKFLKEAARSQTDVNGQLLPDSDSED